MRKVPTKHPIAWDRRQFLGLAGAGFLGALASDKSFGAESVRDDAFLFVEAEGFAEHGGWELDQQSMDQMGSPYLMAHGLGVPVDDAVANVKFPKAGKYRVWVRTKDWVAPWNAPGAPGKFQLLVNGEAIDEIFGTKSPTWHWHDGGTISVEESAELRLRDLTGFNGRCEAILFCADPDFKPSNSVEALKEFRRSLLGLSDEPEDGGSFDFVVVGGGLAGTCAAITAARQGLKVALIQDRPVLGGNGSSEVRVWPEGHTCKEPFPQVGKIVEEILPPIEKETAEHKWFTTMNATISSNFDDQRKLDVVRSEPNITLHLNHRAIATQATDNRVESIVIESTLTGKQKKLTGQLLADCTGDATIGYQAGADHEYEFSADNPLMGSSNLFNVLDASEEKEVLQCECKDKSALMSQYQLGNFEQPFPRCPWALDLSDKPFPGRDGTGDKAALEDFANKWYWESGFDKDQVNDIELIRDHNLRAVFGAWDAL